MSELELRLAYHNRVLEIMRARLQRIDASDCPTVVKEEAELNVLKALLDVSILELQAHEKGMLDRRRKNSEDGTPAPVVAANNQLGSTRP